MLFRSTRVDLHVQRASADRPGEAELLQIAAGVTEYRILGRASATTEGLGRKDPEPFALGDPSIEYAAPIKAGSPNVPPRLGQDRRIGQLGVVTLRQRGGTEQGRASSRPWRPQVGAQHPQLPRPMQRDGEAIVLAATELTEEPFHRAKGRSR